MNWKKISSEYISNHIYFTARKDVCKMPNGQIVDPYFVVELPRTVCALAITENNEAILVRQYRHPVEDVLLELPGGFIDENEIAAQAIARELLEETGYTFTNHTFLASVAANPGVLDNYTDLYLLTGGVKVASQQLDTNEEIEIELFPIEKVKAMLMNNEFKQALHVSCLFYALDKLSTAK